MTKQIVLKLLREHTEEFLSGEAISRQAGVSRAAVWKAMESLRDEGYVCLLYTSPSPRDRG